jgi:branched-subunit amino acid ABC-type transport system permease component
MKLTATGRTLVGIVAGVVGLVVVSTQAWAGLPVTTTNLARLLVFALPLAGIYAISATGLVVVHSATGVFNVAQGAVGMVAAFVYWELNVERGLDQWLALVLVAGVFAPAVGVALDVVLMRRLARAPLVSQLIATVGLTAALLGVATAVWNPNESYPIEALGGDGGIRIADVLLTWHRVITISVALGVAVLLRHVLVATRLGLSMRAVVDDRDLATLHGIRPSRVSSAAWVVGSVTAALAGILIAPEVGNMSAETLSLLIVNAFAAAVVGRLRSLPLTYLGALLLGLVVAYSSTFLDLGGRWVTLPGALPAVLLFAVLFLLPADQVRLGRTLRTYAMERVPTLRSAATAGGVLVTAALVVGPSLSSVNAARFTTGAVTGVILLGLVPLVGWAGIPYFAPYALAGLGAWTTWKLQGEVPALAGLALAGLLVAAVGVVAAIPAIRLRGLYLALSSIAFALVAMEVVFAQPELFAEPRQVARPEVLGMDLAEAPSFLVFVAIVYAVLALGLVALRRSVLGRRLVAMRDSEAAASCLGISLVRTKVVVFAVSGFVAGIGGGLLAISQQFVSVEQFPMIGGLAIILSLVIWGVGNVSAPLVAGMTAALLVAVSQDWATGDWVHAIELVGPGLAALALVGHPRGQIPEVTARSREAPWGTVVRLSAAALGVGLGVGLDLPGFVGFTLTILLYAGADLAHGLWRARRLDPLGGPGAAAGPDDDAAPALGVSVPFTRTAVRRLDAVLRVPIPEARR